MPSLITTGTAYYSAILHWCFSNDRDHVAWPRHANENETGTALVLKIIIMIKKISLT